MDRAVSIVNNINIQIACLIILIIITITYLSKRKVKSYENLLFITLMINNFATIILDIACIIALHYQTEHPTIAAFLTKTYYFSIVYYLDLITYYLIYVTSKDSVKKILNNDNKSKVKVGLVLVAIATVYIISILFLPLKLHVGSNGVYVTGELIKFVYQTIVTHVVFWLLFILMRGRNTKIKKLVPMIVYSMTGIESYIILKYFPDTLVTSFLFTFAIFIMYFAIENPDVELIEELSFAEKQADNASQAKTEFLSSMSHEIRTPLNAILGFSQVLSDTENDEEAKQYIEEVHTASKILLDIVNGILDFSKMEAGKFSLFETDYDPKSVINEFIDQEVEIYSKPSIEFKKNIGYLPNALYGDPNQVKQIIHQLLSNAFKFTANGKITLSATCEEQDDKIILKIIVEDTGLGIKEEDFDNLFKEFEKLETTKNLKIEGAGLGLPIVKRLTGMMDGDIRVQSVYGRGSRFEATLKQAKSNVVFEEEKEVKEESSVTSFNGKKVLLVDDNPMNIKVAERLIKSYDCEVESLQSGAECIEKIKSNVKYDLIFLDDMMPEMDGTETLNNLKQIEGFSTKVIILTANAQSGMREEYISKGFDDYLAKPIKKEELLVILNNNLK